MCGRYNFSQEESEEIQAIVREIERRQGVTGLKTGEIYPTNAAPVLLAENDAITPALFSWGFPGFKGQRVIINARAETAPEKPMFRASLAARRCVIPSTGFYEWDNHRQKYRFNLPDSTALYMAGFYNEFKGEPRYVILTTAANNSIADVHNRMPVVLEKDMIRTWIQDEAAAREILRAEPPLLERKLVS
ncbi:SOS response-associated peptidase [Anaerotruncus rubiinfantis]|uniref:SOS response-associated peptidase n=1 Tax=Anaerotruncus rubiinfantis TaxID=1720200 RepID=UPI0011C842A8|nr:SOS response-associated peptidase [Anaerotruncus rubiinfantis]